MERFRLNQWRVKVDGEDQAIFTTRNCSAEEAMAIAVAMYGKGVTELEDEDFIRQDLTHAQLHVADPKYCALCGSYADSHDEKCSAAPKEEVA
jgi:hypothetical protein